MKDQIVLGVNGKTRERLLRVPDVTFEKALDVVRYAETTETQMKLKNWTSELVDTWTWKGEEQATFQ